MTGTEPDALRHLRRDPIMNTIIDTTRAPAALQPTPLFAGLVESVVSQQLSVRAADRIMERVLALLPNRSVTPQAIGAVAADRLRAAGLSWAKVRYLQGIASSVLQGALDPDAVGRLEDEAAIDALTALVGVGRWTAEMVLIFVLARPDVFSVGDLGLRAAVARHYGVEREDRPAIEAIAAVWSPHRSLASRYLWSSMDNAPPLA